MAEGSTGIMDRIKTWRRGGSTDAHQDVATTHREAGLPLPAAELDGDLPANKSVQAGDNATDLLPEDQEAMEAWKTPQQRQSEIAGQAANAGLPATHPVEPVGPQSTFKPPSEN